MSTFTEHRICQGIISKSLYKIINNVWINRNPTATNRLSNIILLCTLIMYVSKCCPEMHCILCNNYIVLCVLFILITVMVIRKFHIYAQEVKWSSRYFPLLSSCSDTSPIIYPVYLAIAEGNILKTCPQTLRSWRKNFPCQILYY